MKLLTQSALLASGISLLTSPASFAADSITTALQEGTVDLNFRLRYEGVEFDPLDDSDALTLKTRLTYKSADYNGLSFLLEMDDVTAVDKVDYRTAGNDTSNLGTAVIADPEGTEVNQATVSYKTDGSLFTYGRQSILLDNQRFVGGVGWRQNEQTYDAFSFKNTSVEKLTLFYSYVFNANRIFGEDNPIGDHSHETHLLNINYSGWSAGTLIGYAYLIDNQDAVDLSSDTMGIRFSGKAGNFSYTAEYATQSDSGNSTLDYDADYMLLEGGTKLGPVNLTLGYEVLGSDDGDAAFSTPLATLHKFQGWTDRFLGTPGTGVEDLYLSGGFNAVGAKFSLVYHDLAADEGSANYGSEVGFTASKKFGAYGLALKYADYSADDFGSDTSKLWLTLSAKF